MIYTLNTQGGCIVIFLLSLGSITRYIPLVCGLYVYPTLTEAYSTSCCVTAHNDMYRCVCLCPFSVQALMELGARVCTPKSPECRGCPLREHCLAYKRVTTGGVDRTIQEDREGGSAQWACIEGGSYTAQRTMLVLCVKLLFVVLVCRLSVVPTTR